MELEKKEKISDPKLPEFVVKGIGISRAKRINTSCLSDELPKGRYYKVADNIYQMKYKIFNVQINF